LLAQESSRHVASARLRERKDEILDRWKARVAEHVEAAKYADGPELVDMIPELIDRFAFALGSQNPWRHLEDAATWIGKEHGKQRAQLTAFSLEEVIVEYRLLHQTMLDILDEGGPLDNEPRDLISDGILSAIRFAASEFARLRGMAAEAELRQTDTRFRHMVDAVKDYAIFTLDPKGFITTWNVGCIRMKRYTVEEAVGQHFSMLYPAEGNRRDEPMGHLRSAAIEGRFRGEGVRLRKGGDEFLADVSITPIYEGGQVVGYTKVVQDLTERNLIVQERDLSRSNLDQLRAEAEYREQFVATLTHDLRSPLATAKTAADLLEANPADPDKVKGWANKITSALSRTDRMIGDLLDARRVSAGEQLALGFDHIDLVPIVKEQIDELTARHGDRFRIEVEGSTKGFWSGDGLRRVVENLLSNAVKYGEPDGVITVRLRNVDGHVLLSVHNFGTLIPIQDQENLFRVFHRTPTAQKSGKPGWGIGLTLVKSIVEAHGGMVKAESYPKEGTTFTVDLPVSGEVAARA
jgi:PAS domain S-box-containing protein